MDSDRLLKKCLEEQLGRSHAATWFNQPIKAISLHGFSYESTIKPRAHSSQGPKTQV